MSEDAQQTTDASLSVHCLPFKTSFRGTTDIRKNFVPTQPQEEGQPLVAHFRGRRLLGTVVEVPPTHKGCIALIPKMITGVKRERQSDDEVVISALGATKREPSSEVGAAGAGSKAEQPGQKVLSSTSTVLDTFDRFVVWEHDRLASGPERSPLAFIAVASVLHREITLASDDEKPTA